jgi:hypothetical protein
VRWIDEVLDMALQRMPAPVIATKEAGEMIKQEPVTEAEKDAVRHH